MFIKSTALRKNFLLSFLALLLFGTVFLFSGTGSTAVFAQNPPLELTASGPIYIAAGENITYELTVKNTSTQEVTNISFWNDVPANTSYISGGTLIDGDPNYVEFTINSVAANSSQTVTWVAQANSGLALDTIIENNSYNFYDSSQGQAFGSVSTKVEAPGTVVASYKNAQGRAFDVMVDGFGFENFTHTLPAIRTFSDDITSEDVFLMYGPAVCASGNTAETCVLNAAGQQWLEDQIVDMDLGVCDGMAVTSLHIFDGRPFKGYTSPGTIQSGAVNSVDLDFPEAAIENYVSYYYNTQLADEVYSGRINGSANDTIATLTAGMNQTPPTFYTLSVRVLLADGTTKDGHAITPIAIETVSSSESRIIVYDNNFPKQRQYIAVNTAANSWQYVTEATPGEGSSIYEGVGETNPITLTPLNLRDNAEGEYFNCYFCNSSAGSAAATSNKLVANSALTTEPTGLVRFSYSGEGAYVVVDDLGRATGSDSDTGAFVNEIPGAEIVTHEGGLGLNVPPRIIMPFDGADDSYYSVFVHANTEGNVTNGNLNIIGHGFSIGVNDISLDPFEEFELKFSPDGDHISFIATDDIQAPELVIAHDPIQPGNPSVIFDIEGVVLAAGESVMLDLDPELEQIHFSHTGPEAEDFIIDMKLIYPDGDVEDHADEIHIPAGVQTAFIDFGAWDGLLHPPTYIGGVLQNPGANHRLKLENAVGTYDPTPQTDAPAGVYTVEATFSNVTEVSLEDVYFTVANLGPGDVLLNADAGSLGTRVSVPSDVLGTDGILHTFDSFTFSFQVGLADTNFADLTVDANGVPHDWIHPDPAPSYDTNNASFIFDGDEALPNQLTVAADDVKDLLNSGQLSQGVALRLLQNLDQAGEALATGDNQQAIRQMRMFLARVRWNADLPNAVKAELIAQAEFIIGQLLDGTTRVR